MGVSKRPKDDLELRAQGVSVQGERGIQKQSFSNACGGRALWAQALSRLWPHYRRESGCEGSMFLSCSSEGGGGSKRQCTASTDGRDCALSWFEDETQYNLVG